MVQNIIRALALLGISYLGYDHISDDSREVIQPVQTTVTEVVAVEPEPIVIVPPKPDCECLRDFMVSTIGVKEKTGNNDGFWVEKYLSPITIKPLLEQAKEMQKQRMIEFAKQFIDVVNIEDKDIENIYEQTYGGGEQ